MGTPLQKNQSEHLEAQMGAEGLDNLQEVDNIIETSKLSEKVSQTVGENIPTHTKKDDKKDNKKNRSIFGISGKISGILGTQKAKKITKIPSTAVQRTKVERQLRREQKKLLKKAEKIINSRNFSASALEEVIREVRHLQEILSELLRAASKKVEELYRRWVLKG